MERLIEQLKQLTGKELEIIEVGPVYQVLWCDFNKKANLAPLSTTPELAVEVFTKWYKENYKCQ